MSEFLDIDRLMQVARMTGALKADGFGPARKEASLTLSTQASFAGCCGLFTPTGQNDVLSLVMKDEPFLEWLGWVPNNDCDQFLKLVTYISGSGAASGSVSTPYAAACDDANGAEFGTCEILLPDKGRLKRKSPVRDLTNNNVRHWASNPVYTLDGSQITDEIAWSTSLAGIALSDDIKRAVFNSNPAQENQFNGLESVVAMGYRNVRDHSLCSSMDSIVLDWGSQDMAYKVNDRWTVIDYIIDIVRRIKQRANWSRRGGIAVGDMAIVTTTTLATALLDHFTCWSVCTGGQYSEVNLQSYEARMFRSQLNGGLYGMGAITVDQVPVPILAYDWLDFTHTPGGATVSDLYILTRQIGGTRTLTGQYIDMSDPAQAFQSASGYPHYQAIDNGRFLSYWKTENECVENTVVFRPNIWCPAPWAQCRIQNVAGTRPLGPLSPDPASAYFPEQYLGVAYCPEDYLNEGLPSL